VRAENLEQTPAEPAAHQAADAAFTALAWPPAMTGEACAAFLCG
jgi:hypothetical protein